MVRVCVIEIDLIKLMIEISRVGINKFFSNDREKLGRVKGGNVWGMVLIILMFVFGSLRV